MPLVQHNNLPSIERVRVEGVEVRAPDECKPALTDIKIAFLNMMPDAAMAATERQFLRLVGASNNVNCYVYPFTIQGIERSAVAQEHIAQYYCDFEAVKALDIDALIITGANVSQPLLQNEQFWPQLTTVLDWAQNNVHSTLCSCLATHAGMKVFYGEDRQYLGAKCWGVFEHQVLNKQHPLVNNIATHLRMCHSRFNDIPQAVFEKHAISVLIGGEQAGVQLAAEPNMRTVYFQGHPEYDDISLLKEFKREIVRYLEGEIDDYPPVPERYFNAQAMQLIDDYRVQIEQAADKSAMLASFPEQQLRQLIENSWRSAARTIFANWVNHVANECVPLSQ